PIHLRVVDHVEVASAIRVMGHGPVDGQITVYGDHSVAVAGVHQIQVGHLIGQVAPAVPAGFFDGVIYGVLSHLPVVAGVIGDIVHQQAHAAGVHLNLAVVDVVGHTAIFHGGDGIPVNTGLVSRDLA